MTDEPRSLGEALAAGEEEREESGLEGLPKSELKLGLAADPSEAVVPEHNEESRPEQRLDDPEAPVATLDELRAFFAGAEDPAEEEPTVTPEQAEPWAKTPANTASPDMGAVPEQHAPTFADLRALLLSPEFQASVPAPPDLGPNVRFGAREIPLALLELYRRGYLKDWSP